MRLEVMTKILGWMLVASGVFILAVLITLGTVFFGADIWRNELGLILLALLFFFAALPQIISGLLTLHYAGLIKVHADTIASLGPDQTAAHRGIRFAMAFCGVWLTGIIGLTGLGLPRSVGTLAIAGLMVLGLAIAGPARIAQWTRKAE